MVKLSTVASSTSLGLDRLAMPGNTVGLTALPMIPAELPSCSIRIYPYSLTLNKEKISTLILAE